MWPLSKNSGLNPRTFQFLIGGTLDHNSQDLWYVPGFPSNPEAADTPLIFAYVCTFLGTVCTHGFSVY